ncbi:MAG: GNAT family N-acetyltransferase, partial [Pseudomonadota bacterium]
GVDAARTRDVFFSDRYGLRALVVEQAGAVVGYASHRLEFESAFNAVGRYLSDLYVAPGHRRRGVARALIAAVARLTADEGGAFVWWVARADPQATDALYRRLADVEAPVTAFAATQDRFRALAAAASDKP